jgi:IS30 family transposase
MHKSTTYQVKCHSHLSLAEWEDIAIALEQGRSIRSTAESLGRNPSSVSREITRNTPLLNKVTFNS